VLAFVTNWKLTLITGCIAPATIFVTCIASYVEALVEIKILDCNAQAGSFAEGILASARTVQAFDLRSRLVKDFDDYLQESAKLGHKRNSILGCLFSAEYFILFARIRLCFWQAISRLARGEVKEPGDIFTRMFPRKFILPVYLFTFSRILMSVIVAASSLTAITPYLIHFTRAATAAAELFKLMDRPSLIDPLDKSGQCPEAVTGDIEFEEVSFSYPTRPSTKVLDNYSLKIPAGKTTALVGASGSGKSTIIGLLELWYNPTSGIIKLDGIPIERLKLQWLRKQVRLVQQEPVLFSGSIYDNIVNGPAGTQWEHDDREAKLSRVQEAAKIAFAHDFIMNLLESYDTVIGERGGLLSGGQKQRVALARSIISQPRVLLLDGATSALDPHAEQAVQQALDQVSKERTTIIIAHKLSTIRDADNIVVMQNGRIIEQGTYDSLLALDSAFARLVKAQDLSTVEESSGTSTTSGTTEKPELKPLGLLKTLTPYSNTPRGRMDRQAEKDNYDNWKHIGLFSTILRLIRSTPELRRYYYALFPACFVAGKSADSSGRLCSGLDTNKFSSSCCISWSGNSYVSIHRNFPIYWPPDGKER